MLNAQVDEIENKLALLQINKATTLKEAQIAYDRASEGSLAREIALEKFPSLDVSKKPKKRDEISDTEMLEIRLKVARTFDEAKIVYDLAEDGSQLKSLAWAKMQKLI